MAKEPEKPKKIVAENRRARHDYFIEDRYEAGLALEGWEVKAVRAGRANLKEAYVVVKSGEIMLIGAHVSPLTTAYSRPSMSPVAIAARASVASIISEVVRSASCSVCMASSASGTCARTSAPSATIS